MVKAAAACCGMLLTASPPSSTVLDAAVIICQPVQLGAGAVASRLAQHGTGRPGTGDMDADGHLY